MAWWDRIPRRLQAWLTLVGVLCGMLGGAFALGASMSSTVRSLKDVPPRIEALEARDATFLATDSAHATVLRYLMRVDSQRVAVWDSVRGMSSDVRDIRCILKAQVEGTPPTRCLSTYR